MSDDPLMLERSLRRWEGLDPKPQRVHDSEPEHPASCACSFCFEKRQGEIPFDPWFKEPAQIARLYRWLKLLDRLPEDVADFIANAETWQLDYDEMVRTAGPA